MWSPPKPLSTSPLVEIRQLARDRAWPELVRRAESIGEEALQAEPEAVVHFADALWRIGEPARAAAVAGRVERAVQQKGDRALLLNLINVIGIAKFETGRTQDAADQFTQLLDLATEWENDEYTARASNNLGVLAVVRRRYDLALMYYQRALAAYQRLGYLRGLAQTHYNLGVAFRELGFSAKAGVHYERAIHFAERSESKDVVALADSDRGLMRVEAGDPELGEVLATRARDQFEQLSDPVRRAETLRVLAAAARAGGRFDEALSRYAEALEVARAHDNAWLHGEVQRDRGILLRERGSLAEARAALTDAAERFAAIGAEAEADRVRCLAAELPA